MIVNQAIRKFVLEYGIHAPCLLIVLVSVRYVKFIFDLQFCAPRILTSMDTIFAFLCSTKNLVRFLSLTKNEHLDI